MNMENKNYDYDLRNYIDTSIEQEEETIINAFDKLIDEIIKDEKKNNDNSNK